MLKTLLIGITVLIAAVLIFAATRPDSFRIERTITIQAPSEKVFTFINDFHQWPVWSPWEKKDPAMQRSYSGPAQGQGTVYAWEGNSKVGTGRMQITQSTVPSHIAIQLDFLRPFEAHNIAEFTLQPEAGATRVSWAMHGPSPFVSKLMGVFVSMDQMIGKDFEAGLANLKAAAEK